MDSDTTTIRIKKSTKDLLAEYGKKSETYDEIILRLYQEATAQKG